MIWISVFVILLENCMSFLVVRVGEKDCWMLVFIVRWLKMLLMILGIWYLSS